MKYPRVCSSTWELAMFIIIGQIGIVNADIDDQRVRLRV